MTPADETLEALKNRAWRELAAIDAELAGGRIDEAGWFDAMQRLLTPRYLAGADPRAGSGFSGTAADWEVGPFTEERDRRDAESTVAAAGLVGSGRYEVRHDRDARMVRRVLWIDV